MRLHRRKRAAGDAEAAISEAVAAGAEAGERLASASQVRAGADAQAAHEKRTLVSEIRAMRERNNLAALVLGSTQRGEQP